jgi:serine/threonine-protein kinase HipA
MKIWPNLVEVQVDLDFGPGNVIPVGTIATATDQTYFEYATELLARGLNPAPFSTEFEVGAQVIPVIDGKLRSMFADALPDGWTSYLLEARLLESGFDPRSLNQIDKLSLVGGHGVGALSFRPAADSPELGIPPLTLDDLASTVLQNRSPGDAGIEVARKLAGSLGGARPKASIWLEGDQVSAAPIDGVDPWIVKFPNSTTDQPDAETVEYAYSLMARAAGVTMMETKLLEARDSPGYFATARFDRVSGRRYHFQSLAGLLGLTSLERCSYASLFANASALTNETIDQSEMIRRNSLERLKALDFRYFIK